MNKYLFINGQILIHIHKDQQQSEKYDLTKWAYNVSVTNLKYKITFLRNLIKLKKTETRFKNLGIVD